MVKIAVFISGGGTNLQSLIDAVQNKYIDGEIALVISSKENAYGLERARLAGNKAEFIRDEELIIKRLEEEQIELIVSASNQRAIGLYESLGFKTTGRFPNAMKLADDHYDDTLFMIKFLN